MDHLPDQIEFSSPAPKTVWDRTADVLPWLIIGGLLWASALIGSKPAGGTSQPSVPERRDHQYGSAATRDGLLLAVGSGGKIFHINPASGKVTWLQAPTQQILQNVTIRDGASGFSAGNGEMILVSVDGGATWKRIPDLP